jgi:membrane fusion protein (multidrug efflux system)
LAAQSWVLLFTQMDLHIQSFPFTIMKRIVIFASLCAVVCLASCVSKKEEKEEIGKYAVTSPLIVDTSFTKEYVAQIRSLKDIEIRAQEKGFYKTYMLMRPVCENRAVLFRIMPKI